MRRIGTIKDREVAVGNKTQVKVVKNKVAPPFKQVVFDIMWGTGIDRSGAIVDLGVEHDVISKSGSWFNYGDLRLGQGRENVKAFLQENVPLATEIEDKVKVKAGFGVLEAAGEAA